MRRVTLAIPAILTLVALVCPAANTLTNRTSQVIKPGQFSKGGELELQVLAELNLARQKPQEFAKFIEEYRTRFKDDKTFVLRSRVLLATQEGVKAVDEAIAFMKQVKPMSPLDLSPGLSLAALDHVNDLGPKGNVGHGGSDGSDPATRVKRYGDWEVITGENIAFGHDDPRMIVIQLIVDDGVPSRGHRTNIFNPKYRTVGIACGEHKTYRHMCVMDFAGGFREKKATRPVKGRAPS